MRYLTVLFALLAIYSCKKSTTEISNVVDNYGAYIYGHTVGNINASDDIYIRFAQPIPVSIIGHSADESVYNISPNIGSEAFWQDAQTLIIRSKKGWQHDRSYTVAINLDKIFSDVDQKNSSPKFTIHINPIRLSLDLDPIAYEGGQVVISGAVKSTEATDDDDVENMVAAKYRGNSINMKWNHYSSTSHRFEFENIARGANEQEVVLSWKGKNIDSQFEGERRLEVLPANVFTVLEAKVTDSDAKTISVVFSDALDQRQSFDGLAILQGFDKGYRYDVSANQLIVYAPKSSSGDMALDINKAIKRQDGQSLGKNHTIHLSFDPAPPLLALAGKGVIVPDNGRVIFPFRAQNLKGVTVEIFKIYQNNVLQFLQYNKIDNRYGIDPVGRIEYQQHVDLASLSTESNDRNLVRYALDISKLTNVDPGAIYQVRIGFSMADVASYPCASEQRVAAAVATDREEFNSIMRDSYGYDYNWNERKNPCKSSYYRSHNYISRNIFASNLGIIAKVGDEGSVTTTVTDLIDIAPKSGVELTYYDFQQQEIGNSSTAANGISNSKPKRTPSFLIARDGNQYGYLSLQDRDANSLSEYSVSGQSKSAGLDGYIYTERGVWRPGDTIYVDFMLEDRLGKLPSGHPVSLTLEDARGIEQYYQTTSAHMGQIYHFPIPTSSAAITGNWRATVKVGGATFRKTIKVETIKPNRIKVDFEKGLLNISEDEDILLSAAYLHGAPASDLDATVDFSLRAMPTVFDDYLTYTFDDPARKIESYPYQIFKGKLGEDGRVNIPIKKNNSWKPAGKLKARVETKIFEKGGNFSTDTYTLPADLYDTYVGVKLPQNRWGSNYIDQNNYEPIDIVLVDKDGKPLKNRKLNIGLYNAEWNWWYDSGYGGRYRYNSSNHLGAYKKLEIKTDSKGKAQYRPELSGYGNYMLRVCDESTGHCTGGMFYTGTYYSGNSDQEGPKQLVFKTDKNSYNVGEEIKVEIPSTTKSKIFISIEDGEKVQQAFWIDGRADMTKLSIPIDSEMGGNIYIHSHLIQPHNDGENDLPIRMYGVVPISIVDKSTVLKPRISTKAEVRPNTDYDIVISEKNGKAMTYTLAVVDEGLLSLTRFSTPDPWSHFYAKQALGVKTWDVYDFVLSGYGGEVDQYISIGGDASDISLDNAQEINRFDAVVDHLGPFYLKSGEIKRHTLEMKNYVGAVRVMVVARSKQSYGKADEVIKVKQPLMVQSTLPRVLGPKERLDLPANIWSMKDNMGNVDIRLETDDKLKIMGSNTNYLNFTRQGDKLTTFDILVGAETGPTKVTTTVKGNGESAFETTNITIRNPNPFTTEVISKAIQPGERWSSEYQGHGSVGTNEGFLEVSNLPPVNFGRRLEYLMRYPYGCLEQTTSSVFPQLYLKDVAELTDEQVRKTEHNISSAISRIITFQQRSGGLSYWQGTSHISDWGTTYAGHFLIEARDKGYSVPSKVVSDLVDYQSKKASQSYTSLIDQAYRLYMLAQAGDPHIGAMNRLRNNKSLDQTSAYLLAGAYAMIGQQKAAQALISEVKTTVTPYRQTGGSYGSHVRDMAVIAMAQEQMGQKDKALAMTLELSKYLSGYGWHSTQSTAMALLAIGKIYGKAERDQLAFEYSIPGMDKAIQSEKSIWQRSLDLTTDLSGTLSVLNNSQSVQFAKVVISGQRPPDANMPTVQKNIKLEVTYSDVGGKVLDPTKLKQGTDFYVTVSATNLGTKKLDIEEVALTQIFPSGWEIQNDRVTNGQPLNPKLEYQDIRDDRIYSFFDLNGREKLSVKTKLNATYAGKFYMPPVSVEAMYDNEISANTAGQWVQVVR